MKPTEFAASALALPEIPAGVEPGFEWANRLRIGLCYLWRHRRLAQLDDPVRFTEWVQWRKLNDRDPRKPPLVDKVRVKQHVAALLGEDLVTPTLFHGDALPAAREWQGPLVVKARHGCRQHAFLRTGNEDWNEIRRRAARWTQGHYGVWLDEWIYRQLPLGVIVEPFIGTDGALPIDYKIFVFGGSAVCVQVDVDREHGHRRAYFDRDWRCLWSSPGWIERAPPPSFGEMWAASERLGRDFDFVRCDFYDIEGRARFGEMTFYPGSGLRPLGDAMDYWLGGFWSEARRAMR